MAATLETGNRFNMGDNYHAHDLMQAKGWGETLNFCGPLPAGDSARQVVRE